MTSRGRSSVFFGVFLALGALTLPAARSGAKDTKAGKPKDCIDVHAEASFASVGYDHIVTVKNDCKQPKTCSVKTNVNPEASIIDLNPGESKSVVTWRGSPAREFTPDVTCTDRKPSKAN